MKRDDGVSLNLCENNNSIPEPVPKKRQKKAVLDPSEQKLIQHEKHLDKYPVLPVDCSKFYIKLLLSILPC